MTGRERFPGAINRTPIDRVPRFDGFWMETLNAYGRTPRRLCPGYGRRKPRGPRFLFSARESCAPFFARTCRLWRQVPGSRDVMVWLLFASTAAARPDGSRQARAGVPGAGSALRTGR